MSKQEQFLTLISQLEEEVCSKVIQPWTLLSDAQQAVADEDYSRAASGIAEVETWLRKS